MLWIKRNLAWTLVILVGVLLTGAGGYYIWTGMDLNDQLTQKLGAAKTEYTRLSTEVRPSPTPENVRAAREDVRKAQEFRDVAMKLFVPTPYHPLNNQTYRSMLENNLDQLRRLAVVSGVQLPTNYCFSFDPQTRQLNYEPASLRPLSDELTEISEVCKALFEARIHRLELIRRVAVSRWDSVGPGSPGILPYTAATTNRYTGLWAWPYEFTFECFSGELAAAITEMDKIPRMLVIKTVSVEPVVTGLMAALGVSTPPPGAPPPERVVRAPFRPGVAPGAAPGGPAPKPAALTTVLEERLLKVVLQVQVAKPAK